MKLGKYFRRIEFQRRLRKKDIGQWVLYRDSGMTGWAYCIVSEDNVNRVLMISGHGKRARLLVMTRGLGDHDLEALGGLFVKPFLTPVPQIQVLDNTCVCSSLQHVNSSDGCIGSILKWKST